MHAFMVEMASVMYVRATEEYTELCRQLPKNQRRVEVVEGLIEACGLGKGMKVVDVVPASRKELERFHGRTYLEALESPPEDEDELEDFGLVDDCPVFDGMLLYGLLTAGGALMAAKAVADGSFLRAIWWHGGRHHARWDSAAGFCYVNDIALACDVLADRLGRVLYLDLDAHHGDGVEEAFFTTSKVMTVSFHHFSRVRKLATYPLSTLLYRIRSSA